MSYKDLVRMEGPECWTSFVMKLRSEAGAHLQLVKDKINQVLTKSVAGSVTVILQVQIQC